MRIGARLRRKLKRTLIVFMVGAALIAVPCLIFNVCMSHSLDNEERYLMKLSTREKLSERFTDGLSPAILMIHGFGGSPFDVRPLAEILEKRGYAVKAVLLPGHGTRARDLKDIKKEEWLKESFACYRDLKDEYGDVSIVGFSMGGAIGLCIAAENEVDKLVLISPYFKVRKRWFNFGRPEDWARRFSWIIPYVRKPKMGQINDPNGLRRYVAYMHLPTKAVNELDGVGTLAKEKAKRVTCPTLWAHSGGDIVADFRLSKQIFKSVPASKKYFIEYQKSNHIILYDYDSQDLSDKIVSFFEEGFR